MIEILNSNGELIKAFENSTHTIKFDNNELQYRIVNDETKMWVFRGSLRNTSILKNIKK